MNPEQDSTVETPTASTPTPGNAAGAPGRLPPGVSPEALWEIARHHGVVRMRLVGGWARGDAAPTAPVELIVGYQRKVTQMDVIRLRMEFEGIAKRAFTVREESTVSIADREVLRREARLI